MQLQNKLIIINHYRPTIRNKTKQKLTREHSINWQLSRQGLYLATKNIYISDDFITQRAHAFYFYL